MRSVKYPRGGWVKFAIFDRNCHLSQKWYETGDTKCQFFLVHIRTYALTIRPRTTKFGTRGDGRVSRWSVTPILKEWGPSIPKMFGPPICTHTQYEER